MTGEIKRLKRNIDICDLINRAADNEIVQQISLRSLEEKLNSLNDKVESESVHKLKDLSRENERYLKKMGKKFSCERKRPIPDFYEIARERLPKTAFEFVKIHR